MIKLYRHALSGHSHRVELFLSLLGLEYELVDVDLMNGDHTESERGHTVRWGSLK